MNIHTECISACISVVRYRSSTFPDLIGRHPSDLFGSPPLPTTEEPEKETGKESWVERWEERWEERWVAEVENQQAPPVRQPQPCFGDRP